MQLLPFQPLACPLDLAPLHPHQKSWQCANRHNFDMAKDGHLNLLPVQLKQSKNPGDDAAMVQARRQFLATNLYDCILQKITEIILEQIIQPHINIIDAGCGEGYYTNGVMQALQANLSQHSFSVLGFDISKDAIKAAAKNYKNTILWAVATNKKIPVLPQAAHIVLSLFGFPVFEEFKRVLAPGGLLITVDPAAQHLIELRQALYTEVKTKTANATSPQTIALNQHFELVAAHQVHTVKTGFDPAQMGNLLAMTPHAHKAPPAAVQALLQSPPPTLTIDVAVNVYRPINK